MKHQSEAAPSIKSLALSVVHNQATASSIEIAQVFEKRHDNVLQAIQNLECPDDFRSVNFKDVEIIEENAIGGKVVKKYCAITRDGFTILAMGFTGAKAMKFKLAYIEAFNRMEAELMKQIANSAPATTHITPAQARQIQKKIAERVYQCTPHGSEHTRRDVFASFHRGLKDTFQVPSYVMIPSDKFEIAMAYLDMTGPTLTISSPAPIDENALAIRISNEVIKQIQAAHPKQRVSVESYTHQSVTPTENGTPVTDFGTFSERPWKTAQKLHPELYAKLEAKYAELGKDKHRGVEALRNSMFYETEEFGTLMDYMIHKMPRYLESILKLQLAALGHGVIMEEVGKLADLRRFPTLNFTDKKK